MRATGPLRKTGQSGGGVSTNKECDVSNETIAYFFKVKYPGYTFINEYMLINISAVGLSEVILKILFFV